MRNPCIDAAITELRKAGIYDYEIAQGGKHPQIHWGANGTRRFYAVPGTPSDVRSVHNVRADIRRLLRADGLAAAPKSTSSLCGGRRSAREQSSAPPPTRQL
jgi:hypothetical protein